MGTFYEFFAGGGMAHAGLGADWQCLFANDFCKKKEAAYKANWGDKVFVGGDIAEVTIEQLIGHADLAWASFPCQDLSLAGNKLGLGGERSGTFWKFMEVVRGLRVGNRKPPMIALENVYGALTSHSGKDFEAIVKAVADEGYNVGAMVIDAIHFVPQSRPRLFIIAVDKALPIPDGLQAQTANPAWQPAVIIKAFNRLPKRLKDRWIWWNLPVPAARLQTLDEIIEENPTGVEWHSPAETRRLLEMMTDVNRQKVMLAQQTGRLKVGTIYRRTREGKQRAEVRFDGVSGCLRTPSGGSSRQTIIVVNGNEVHTRLLSPREAARLMGLDDGYILPQRYNDAYHLAGDGVVVPVVEHLRLHIFDPIAETLQDMRQEQGQAA